MTSMYCPTIAPSPTSRLWRRQLSASSNGNYTISSTKTYLQGRTSMVRVKKEVSESSVIRTGVPQGSVLGPILFNIYFAPLAKLLRQHGIQRHLYFDDTQLYVDFPPTKHADLNVNFWFFDNGLILIWTKSHAIVIRSTSVCAPIK